MDQGRRSRAASALLCALLVLALGGCGSNSETRTTATGEVLSSSTPLAGMNTCVNCHPSQTSGWVTSRHANMDNPGGVDSKGTPTLGQVATGCTANCHNPTGDSANLTRGYTGNVARPVIGCEACHGPGSLHVEAGGMGPISVTASVASGAVGTYPVSGQFLMCTRCHQLLDSAGTGTRDTIHSSPSTTDAAASGIDGADYSITDTHFAAPGDWSGLGSTNTKTITGYAFDYSGEKACSNCHNPHGPTTENREWAHSAHADTNPYNLNATKSGYFSGAWAHYNWSLTSSTSNRMACQRCHTTTGFVAYTEALRTGNTTMADILNAGTPTSYAAVRPNALFKPEMLKCNGCHTNSRGSLRNPGAITANYNYISGGNTYAKASHSYPDLAGSNVCMGCHTGRESGESIKALNNPALLSSGTITSYDFANMGFINSHYLTAGGQVFTASGYEFPGRPYNNISDYRHDKIGTPATSQLYPYVDTGSNGPCVGCHMSRPNKNGNHLFLPVSRSTMTYGYVTGIASDLCFKCHGPSSTVILDMVREQKSQFEEALLALEEQLEDRGFYFAHYNPYFFVAPGFDPLYSEATASTHCVTPSNIGIKNWQTGGTSTFTWDTDKKSCVSGVNLPGTAGTGPNNLGAAFNFNLLEHDPGAYAHNRMYAKRLIYDSIDWLDDNDMNYSVGDTLTTLCTGGSAPAYCTEAMRYLLPNGTWGFEAERP